MELRQQSVLACIFACFAGLAGYGLHAYAEGAPTLKPVFYAGTLEASGKLASGAHTIVLTMFDAETAGQQVCVSETVNAPVEAGRFRVEVSPDCVAKMKAQPDLWVALKFSGPDGVPHEIPLRTKIGAVPYAMEAQHAVSASGAFAGGALATTLSTLQAAIETLKGLEPRILGLETNAPSRVAFLAQDTNGDSIETGKQPIVVFENVVFNYGAEYNSSDGALTSKSGGLYDIRCNIVFFGTSGTGPYLEAGIFINGARTDVAAGRADPNVAAFRAQALLKLNANDVVTCRAYQNSGSTMRIVPPRSGEVTSSFSAMRLGTAP